MIASENGEQLHENKVWAKGVEVVKVESIQIIRYGPYVKVEMKIRKWESADNKGGVCEIIVLATIRIVLLHAVR